MTLHYSGKLSLHWSIEALFGALFVLMGIGILSIGNTSLLGCAIVIFGVKDLIAAYISYRNPITGKPALTLSDDGITVYDRSIWTLWRWRPVGQFPWTSMRFVQLWARYTGIGYHWRTIALSALKWGRQPPATLTYALYDVPAAELKARLRDFCRTKGVVLREGSSDVETGDGDTDDGDEATRAAGT